MEFCDVNFGIDNGQYFEKYLPFQDKSIISLILTVFLTNSYMLQDVFDRSFGIRSIRVFRHLEGRGYDTKIIYLIKITCISIIAIRNQAISDRINDFALSFSVSINRIDAYTLKVLYN